MDWSKLTNDRPHNWLGQGEGVEEEKEGFGASELFGRLGRLHAQLLFMQWLCSVCTFNPLSLSLTHTHPNTPIWPYCWKTESAKNGNAFEKSDSERERVAERERERTSRHRRVRARGWSRSMKLPNYIAVIQIYGKARNSGQSRSGNTAPDVYMHTRMTIISYIPLSLSLWLSLFHCQKLPQLHDLGSMNFCLFIYCVKINPHNGICVQLPECPNELNYLLKTRSLLHQSSFFFLCAIHSVSCVFFSMLTCFFVPYDLFDFLYIAEKK